MVIGPLGRHGNDVLRFVIIIKTKAVYRDVTAPALAAGQSDALVQVCKPVPAHPFPEIATSVDTTMADATICVSISGDHMFANASQLTISPLTRRLAQVRSRSFDSLVP